MTVFDAREALEIAEKATPGPWVHEQTLTGQGEIHSDIVRCGEQRTILAHDGEGGDADFHEADARFIAYARTALPLAAALVTEMALEVRKTQDDQDATERQRCTMRESRDEWQALAEKSIAEFYRLQALALEAVALGKERCESGLRCSYNKAESDPYRAALARFAELAKEVAQ